jgi:hypothetical protein
VRSARPQVEKFGGEVIGDRPRATDLLQDNNG